MNDEIRDDGRVMLGAVNITEGVSSQVLNRVLRIVEETRSIYLFLDTMFNFEYQLTYREILRKLANIVKELWYADANCMETPYTKLPPGNSITEEQMKYFLSRSQMIVSGKKPATEERVFYAQLIVNLLQEINKYNEPDMINYYDRKTPYPLLSEIHRRGYR